MAGKSLSGFGTLTVFPGRVPASLGIAILSVFRATVSSVAQTITRVVIVHLVFSTPGP